MYRLADKYLAAITGMSHFTFQPCAGAHGELTGLMLMRAYHESRGDEKRKRIIVPDSAHGTNPASAAMCGLDVVVVKSGENGLVDVESLKPLLGDDLAGTLTPSDFSSATLRKSHRSCTNAEDFSITTEPI